MKLQSGTTGCGAAALANALLALGFDIEQEAVGKLADTNGDGTNARGLKRAAASLGAEVATINAATEYEAWFQLTGWLHHGAAVVLLFDKGEHWVTAVGTSGADHVLVVDPAMVVRDHLEMMDREDLLAAWRWKTKRPFYAICLVRRET